MLFQFVSIVCNTNKEKIALNLPSRIGELALNTFLLLVTFLLLPAELVVPGNVER